MNTWYRRHGKRILDLALTIPALILLTPIFLVIALLVRLTHGSPVIFRQRRSGLHGQTFVMYKFRSMKEERDGSGRRTADSQRLTRFGKLLRKTSLDELPGLFNVLRGEMSLIGPRPLIARYLPFYTERERARFDLLPGVSGYAQVRGRNSLPWDERLELDVHYVQSCSLWLDLKLIALTILKVVRQENVQANPDLTVGSLDEERLAAGMAAPAPIQAEPEEAEVSCAS